MIDSPSGDLDFDRLVSLSAAIGADNTLVQGAGGNTSWKDGNTLWVKTSGKWLADAGAPGLFTPVNLHGLLEALAGSAQTGEEIDVVQLVPPQAPRPSMEVSIHGLMQRRAVLHVHSVATIAHAIRRDGPEVLAQKLAGLSWQWVPYARPGRQLAALAEPALVDQPDILVLANHGLFVQGDDLDAAEATLREVERRLAVPLAALPAPAYAELNGLAAAHGYLVPEDAGIHAAALMPELVRQLAGALYPDHVIYLGLSPLPLVASDDLAALVDTRASSGGTKPAFVLVEGKGVLVSPDFSRSALAMLDCLGQVLRRIAPGTALTTLSADQEAALLGSEAERHRMGIAK